MDKEVFEQPMIEVIVVTKDDLLDILNESTEPFPGKEHVFLGL